MIKRKLCCGKWGCGYFLALESKDKSLSIKYRDLYIAFEGGILRITCPACGTRNFVCTDEYAKAHPERVDSMQAPPDVINVIYKDWIDKKKYQKGEAT